MSLLNVYHDPGKALMVCDDRMSRENPVTLIREKVEGRICKIAVVPRNVLVGTVGRVDLSRRILAGADRLCRDTTVDFEQLAIILPPMLHRVWTTRPPIKLSESLNKQDTCLLGTDHSGRIRCFVFRSEDDFAPIETTADAGNRLIVLGGFDLVDQKLLQKFTMDIGVPGEKMKAPWVAAKLRDMVNKVSALHPVSIGNASFFAAINRDGPIALPEEFPAPPNPNGVAHAASALAQGGNMYVGSVMTPPAGGQDTVGNNDGGAGAQIGNVNKIFMSIAVDSALDGTATLTNPNYALDGDTAHFATLSLTSNSTNDNRVFLDLMASPGISRNYSSATIVLQAAIPTNSLVPSSPTATVAGGSYDFGDGVGSHSAFTASQGVTQALTTYRIPIPLNTNLSLIKLNFFVSDEVAPSPTFTGGTLTMTVKAWIEAIE